MNKEDRIAIARQLLAQIHIPRGKRIEAIIFALDLNPTVFVHFNPFQGDGRTKYDDWAACADQKILAGPYVSAQSLFEALPTVWPDRVGGNAITVYDGRCTCCCDGVEKLE